ncbi:hypothetical protein SGGBAA2069_c11100 [Streptococcus gallolyticus subsp. gallolyticus ATCC BAA-2069]|nr:hypothetical protein SGGBAA2069_c11100 [Streptococcus gallolyticus subsp. gallolyticus ATCC BAA-2069]
MRDFFEDYANGCLTLENTHFFVKKLENFTSFK